MSLFIHVMKFFFPSQICTTYFFVFTCALCTVGYGKINENNKKQAKKRHIYCCSRNLTSQILLFILIKQKKV